MYSWALVPVRTCTSWHSPQQEACEPPRMEGTTIFLFLFITTTTKRILHCTILQFETIQIVIPYLLFERFTLIFAPFLFMCTTKPPRIDGTTFFPFFITKEGTIFNQKFKNQLHFYIFCAGFNFNFTNICQICTKKPPRINNHVIHDWITKGLTRICNNRSALYKKNWKDSFTLNKRRYRLLFIVIN